MRALTIIAATLLFAAPRLADSWSISIQGTRFDDNLRQLMVGVGWGLTAEHVHAD